MKDLKQQHAALTAESIAIENSLPQLEAAWKNAPSNFNQYGNEIGTPERRAAMERASDAEARLRAIPGELQSLERKIAHLERLSQVDQTKSESLKTMSEAAIEIKGLEMTQMNLSARLQTIQSEAEQALEKAQQEERDAASRFARSLACGDSKAEKKATNDIQVAATQLAATDEHVRRQELIISALQSEITNIETQIYSASQRENEAKRNALSAIALALDEEWNEAAKQLAAVGAKVLAVCYQQGGMGDALSGLEVPRFGPFLSRLNRSDLTVVAREITLSSLLKA
ncbi:hypothetical protein ACIPV9_04435 [Pseudomonas psychrophila]|uniref:hypothetical protein n=1 Tax=Pseudomonas psychrophila TaxID=122355 RepID=UPI0038077D23